MKNIRTRTVFRILLTKGSVFIRQIFVLAAVLTVCGLFVSLNNYDFIYAFEWYGNVDAPHLGKVRIGNLDDFLKASEIPDSVAEKAYYSYIELKGVSVSQPNEEEPRFSRYSTGVNLVIAPEEEFSIITGTGNLLKQISNPDPERRGAWIDYNTASTIRSGVGDKLWLKAWHEGEDRDELFVFEFEIRGILKPYSDVLVPVQPKAGIVLLEEGNLTDKLLSLLSPQRLDYDAAYYSVLLSTVPENGGDYIFMSPTESRWAAFWQLYSTAYLLGCLAFIGAASLLIVFVAYRETDRVLHSSVYPASVLISLGVSTASIRRHFLALQYACFVVAALVALAILKFFLFQQLLGWYFGIGLFWLNIVFWTLLFSGIMLASKRVRRLSELSLLTLHKHREEMM